MKKTKSTQRDAAALAAERLAEIETLFQEIRDRLKQMIRSLGTSEAETPKKALSKLDELQSAHLRILAAEDALRAKTGEVSDEDAIDFKALRIELGRRIDRIRASLEAEKASGRADRR